MTNPKNILNPPQQKVMNPLKISQIILRKEKTHKYPKLSPEPIKYPESSTVNSDKSTKISQIIYRKETNQINITNHHQKDDKPKKYPKSFTAKSDKSTKISQIIHRSETNPINNPKPPHKIMKKSTYIF